MDGSAIFVSLRSATLLYGVMLSNMLMIGNTGGQATVVPAPHLCPHSVKIRKVIVYLLVLGAVPGPRYV